MGSVGLFSSSSLSRRVLSFFPSPQKGQVAASCTIMPAHSPPLLEPSPTLLFLDASKPMAAFSGHISYKLFLATEICHCSPCELSLPMMIKMDFSSLERGPSPYTLECTPKMSFSNSMHIGGFLFLLFPLKFLQLTVPTACISS